MSEVLKAPQQDRSRATRQRLLEAAVESLAEVGYAATTVSVVATRAGVSRGRRSITSRLGRICSWRRSST